MPLIRDVGVGTQDRPVIDLGCGRGEWLNLLREEGLAGKGVDDNYILVEQCGAQGLNVVQGEMLEYLRGLEDGSAGAITGFHIVEHLPLEYLVQTLDETTRVLVPGGVAIFETPNPENILVSSQTFHLDPTHLKPLPCALMQYLVEDRGLSRVEILKLNPYPDSAQLENDSPVAQRLNELLYGPRDYAVIGYKT